MMGEIMTWRQIAMTISCISIPHIIILYLLPESPIFYLQKGKAICFPMIYSHIRYLMITHLFVIFIGDDKVSLKIWTMLRESPEAAMKEIEETKVVLNNARKGGVDLLELMRPPYRWPVKTALLLMVFQQFTGMGVIQSFASTIFELAGSFEYAGISSIIFALVNVFCSILNGRLLAVYNRKDLLNVSSKVVIFAQLILSAFLYARTTDGFLFKLSEQMSYIPLLSLTIFAFGFSLGWGLMPFVFLGEGLTSNVRGITSSLAMAAMSAAGFIVTKLFSLGISYFGLHGLFVTFAILTFLSQTIMDGLLPETKGKSMLQMDELYQSFAIDWYKNKIKKLT